MASLTETAVFPKLPCGEGVISCDIDKVAGVVQRKYTDIVSAAYLKSIDAAVGRNDPRRLFGVPSNGAHQMKSEEADRPGV